MRARTAAVGAAILALATALQQGISPATVFQSRPVAIPLGDLDAVRGFIGTLDELRPGLITPFLRALADRSRARIAVIEGDGVMAERTFKAAIGLFRETGIPYWRALSQLEYAEHLVAGRRSEDAAPMIQEARDSLDRLGASTWLERLDQLEAGVVTAG